MKKLYTAISSLLFCSAVFAQTTVNFVYTGSVQTWVVPPGVTSITVDARGAEGGDGINPSNGDGQGGLGGRVEAIIPVTPGETLEIYVGGVGSIGIPGGGPGGFNGGGDGEDQYAPGSWMGGGGGGASDIRQGGSSLAERVIVAGGGGGGGSNCGIVNGNAAGNGGGLVGGDGISCTTNGHGIGGDQSGGGAGGLYQWDCGSGGPAQSGTLGNGGDADICSAGGGGGGGYYGGGGGDFGGAGGGSSFTSLNATSVVHTGGFQTGDGSISITYMGPTGINALNAANNLEVFPVPSKGIFNLSSPLLENSEILVYNYLGELVLKTIAESNSLKLDLTNQPEGIYFVEVKNVGMLKVVVVK
jgi:hypothetical protein